PHTTQARSSHPRLRRQESRRRQDAARDQTLPQTLRRSPALPATRSQRTGLTHTPSTPQPHPRHLPLTNIEASLAVGLAMEALRAGYLVRYMTLDDIVRELRQADQLGTLRNKLAHYQRPHVLI